MWAMQAANGLVPEASEDLVLDTVREAIGLRRGEIWIEHRDGPILEIVIGGSRAMVLRLAQRGDAGYHATDLTASPRSSHDYVLVNGQVDDYADRDMVEIRHVMPIRVHVGQA